MAYIIVFDVNETLLDLAPVREWFGERFDDRPSASVWFSELLRLSFVSSVIDRYLPFTELAAAALDTVAARSEADIDGHDLDAVRKLLTKLPAHSDVETGLDRLRANGFTVAALTNSPQSTAENQLANAGIIGRFDTIMSVDMVRRFKPHRSVYQAAASHLGISTSGMVMVAAHDWDVAGAMEAGAKGVFISRPGQVYSSSLAEPAIIAQDVDAASREIVDRYA
jgi:2-haloacid dehalogenase